MLPIDFNSNQPTTLSGRGAPQVYKAIGKAPYHVLAMDDQKFHDMMVEPGKRRDFPVVALFTAAGPKYGCTPCQ